MAAVLPDPARLGLSPAARRQRSELMKTLTLISALLVGGLAGCGGGPPPASPVDEAAPPEPDVTEPEMTEPEMTEPEATEPEVAEPEAPPPPEEPTKRPVCEGTPKSTCQVTQGCAWRDKGGKGECIPHGDF